uniref:FBD domain-containing protein n=1 Tax=Oryza brachyantha TaxID=4533 RepID=J3ND98_ORYBR
MAASNGFQSYGLEIDQCAKLSSLPPIPWTPTLQHVSIRTVRPGLERLFLFDNSLTIEGNKHLCSLDEKVLAFHNLTGLNRLIIRSCPHLIVPSEGPNNTRYKLAVDSLVIERCSFSGKEGTHMLSHFSNISTLCI